MRVDEIVRVDVEMWVSVDKRVEVDVWVESLVGIVVAEVPLQIYSQFVGTSISPKDQLENAPSTETVTNREPFCCLITSRK